MLRKFEIIPCRNLSYQQGKIKSKSRKVVSNSRYLPDLDVDKFIPSFKVLTKKTAKPSFEEIKENPRSRSARLRAAIKLNTGGAYA